MNANIQFYDFSNGTAHIVTDDPENQDPWDITQDYLVYADEQYGIYNEIILFSFNERNKRRITADESRQDYPRVDSDHVIWMDFRNGWYEPEGSWYNSDIYLYTISTDKEVPLTLDSTADQEFGDVHGDFVAWTDLRHGGRDRVGQYMNSEVYLYRISTGQRWRITESEDTNEYAPKLHGTAMIYYSVPVGGSRYDKHVYYYDFSHLLEGDGG